MYATRHYNHEYRIRFSNFMLQVRKIRNRKVSSRHSKKEESYVPCSLTPRYTRNSFKNGLAFRDSLVLRHKKTTAELTERVSDVLGGLPPPVRHRQERSTVEKVSWDRLKALRQSAATTCRCPRVLFFIRYSNLTTVIYVPLHVYRRGKHTGNCNLQILGRSRQVRRRYGPVER